MSTIRLVQTESSGLNSRFEYRHHTLRTGKVLGKGGFGEVMECLTLDGVAPEDTLVVKILGGSADAVARNGYETIALLCRRVRQTQARRREQGDMSLASLPGLAGLPLFHFEGEKNGQRILGYVMYRLDSYGFQPLEDLTSGESPDRRQRYLHRSLKDRTEIAVCLVRTLHILMEELGFLHRDINEPNLWIHRSQSQCALIDYDGGRFIDQTHRATTFGKMGEWLAPEIMQEAGKPQGKPWEQVSHTSEYWTLWVAVSYLLFLVHPLFF